MARCIFGLYSSFRGSFSPSTMLDLAMKPDEAFKAPLNTTKLAPVTVEDTAQALKETRASARHLHLNGRSERPLTSASLPSHAVGLSLVVSVLILETDQVRVGLQAEMCPDADDVLIGRIHHFLHLWDTQNSSSLDANKHALCDSVFP